MLTVDKFGRRPLLLLGVGGMFASALIIGIACQIAYSSVAATYITIAFLFVFVGSYQVIYRRVYLLPGPTLSCPEAWNVAAAQEHCAELDEQCLVMLQDAVFLPCGS